jgi:hypothetical protein
MMLLGDAETDEGRVQIPVEMCLQTVFSAIGRLITQ